MAIEVTVPRLGWSMDEGTLTEWLKRDGDRVAKGDLLFVLEGDKAAQEIESFDEGVLRLLPDGPRPGDTVKVGQVIALLMAENELLTPAVDGSKPPARAAMPAPASPSARRQAREQQTAASTLPTPPATDRGPQSSPRARRRARELGVDWRTLQGTGKSGRIVERDIVPETKSTTEPSIRRIAHSTTRRTIAKRMLDSRQSTASVTLTTTADATNLVSLRDQFRTQAAAEGAVPGYSDLIAKLTALVLVEFPALNARWEDEAAVFFGDVHLGIAVDTEAGLLVPVVRDAHRLSLRELAACAHEQVAKAHARSLLPGELQGGTFTISNLGAYGIDAFTPILNDSQCAILGLGRIRAVPTCVGAQVVPREQMTLSLTFDHRLVDGGPAARFLQAVVQAIENPAARLIG